MRKRLAIWFLGSAIFIGLLSPAGNFHCLEAAPTAPGPESTPADAMESAREAKIAEVIKSLHYQQGEVTLNNGLAKLAVPQSFRYLNPEDASKVLHDLWGNPPRTDTLGMLLPTDVGPNDPACWAVVIDYDEQGYIKDDEADTIDYNSLLTKMKTASEEANKQRVAEGYRPMELIGWAAPPRYDKVAKKMYWAKEIKVQGAEENTLNYNIRILGRRGVLILNAISGMSQLADIEKAAPSILSMVDFKEGHRYADFNPKTDKVAAIGIAALVAGGVAAKMGLFKVVLVGLLAAKKFVIVAVVAVGAWIKRLFGAGREKRL